MQNHAKCRMRRYVKICEDVWRIEMRRKTAGPVLMSWLAMAWRAPSTPKHLRRGLHQRSPFRSFLFRCPPGPPVTLGCEIRKVIRFRNWDFNYIYHLINHINSHICIISYYHYYITTIMITVHLYLFYCSQRKMSRAMSSFWRVHRILEQIHSLMSCHGCARVHSGHPLWCYDCPILFVATWFSVKEDCGFSSLETFPETMSSRIPNARL